MPQDKQQRQMTQELKVEVPAEVHRGVYSNFSMIAHTPNEFVLDFGSSLPGKEGITVVARVIVSPQHAKALIESLKQNVGKYEEQFGTIPPMPGKRPPGMGFRHTTEAEA